ncbi:MAG: DNA-binding transcriptional LysR family regulator [Spirosomataceae bacterium]|jgi:DNA-binding transcriptional LysR family regulator
MNTRQLHYFLVLADELHFKNAAGKLFIVQPALTKQIQNLEESLGVKLFTRNKRNVALTEAGHFLRRRATRIVTELEEIKQQIRLVDEGHQGEIRIGYVGSCIHTFLPDCLTTLHDTFPSIQTYLSEMTSASQFSAVLKSELDVAFLRNPPSHKRIEQRMVFQETFSLVLPKKHWLSPENFEGMQQVSDENFILPTKSDGENYHRLQWSICEDAGFSPTIAHETVHGQTVLRLIEHNLGLSLLPTSFQTVTNAAVKFIELKNIPQRAEISMIWDTQNSNKSLPIFRDILEKAQS